MEQQNTLKDILEKEKEIIDGQVTLLVRRRQREDQQRRKEQDEEKELQRMRREEEELKIKLEETQKNSDLYYTE